MPEFEPIATFSSDKEDVVIFDIDGTLANKGDRDPYDMTRVSEDEVYEDITKLVTIMSQHYKVIFVSGRDDSCARDTVMWLEKNISFAKAGNTTLHMRDEGDNRSDAIVKYEIAQKLNEEYNIRYIFDDRSRVVKMWREAGFRVLQVQDGNF